MFDLYLLNRTVSVIESCILVDGLISSVYFLGHYFLYLTVDKFTDNVNKKEDDNQLKLDKLQNTIIEKCRNLYTLNILDRYISYSVVYASVSFMCYMLYMFSCDTYTYRHVFIVLAFPPVQNKIIAYYNNIYETYCMHKMRFIRYTLSKYITRLVSGLHNDIVKIKNYNILLLYQCVSIDYAVDFCKSYVFVYTMCLLRSFSTTYYIYKSIKVAYYYKYGYNFNLLQEKDALYIVNVIVSEKRWSDLVKLDVVNAIYTLLKPKPWTLNSLFIEVLKLGSIWTIISVLKISSIYVHILFGICYLYFNCSLFELYKLFCVGLQLYYNVNDLLICVTYVLYAAVYEIINDVSFYAYHRKSIGNAIESVKKKAN